MSLAVGLDIHSKPPTSTEICLIKSLCAVSSSLFSRLVQQPAQIGTKHGYEGFQHIYVMFAWFVSCIRCFEKLERMLGGGSLSRI